METNVKKIHQDGIEISLMDGSKWRIKNMGNISKTILWYPTQRIKIKEENQECTLTNLDTFSSGEIEVSRIR
jgi:hypothetical protein